MAFTNPALNTLTREIPQSLAASNSVAQLTVGTTVGSDDGGKEFEYVKYECSGVAAVSGAPAIFSTDTGTVVVTADTSDGDAEGGAFAGVFCSDQANQNGIYLWIQTKGEVPDASVDSGVAAGDMLYVNQSDVFAAVDDNFDSTKDYIFHAVAVAKEAASGASGTSKADIVLL